MRRFAADELVRQKFVDAALSRSALPAAAVDDSKLLAMKLFVLYFHACTFSFGGEYPAY